VCGVPGGESYQRGRALIADEQAWWSLGLPMKMREQRYIFGGMGADRRPSFDRSDMASRPARPRCSTPEGDVERLYGEIDHLSSADGAPWVTAYGTSRAADSVC